jgi:hypothetical protein
MKLPNKVNTFSDSVIALFTPILEKLEKRDMTPHELYIEMKTRESGINAFFAALDCLYALGKIEIPEGTEVLRYVKTRNV